MTENNKEALEEIDAISKIIESLSPLPNEARKRTLEYVRSWIRSNKK